MLGQCAERELLRDAEEGARLSYRCRRYQTRDEARANIFEYIEGFYTRMRRHSHLAYVCPVDVERQWIECRAHDAEVAAMLPNQSMQSSPTTNQAA